MTAHRLCISLLVCLGGPLPTAHAGEAGGDQSALVVGKRLFTKDATPACAICHALKDAGAVGAIGPSLDELRPDQQRVMKAIRNGIGQMPPYTTLSDTEIQAIAEYVTKASSSK